MHIPKNIILSRTDGIGDMALMLPMAAVISEFFPDTKIAVLGKPYTKPLVDSCKYVDEFIDAKDFYSGNITVCGQAPEVFINVRTHKEDAKRAKKLKIPMRIGTKSRLYHWSTCNRLIMLKRKSSDLHEAQLNLKLLKPLGIDKEYTTEELGSLYGLERFAPLEKQFEDLIEPNKYNLIIHPKSQGSSREWPIENFISLINMLDEDRYNIFLSGVEKEKAYIDEIVAGSNRKTISLAGRMPLTQFLSFIKRCDGILANATGPLHLGAAIGVDAFGLYPPIRPIHPGRWAPLGPKAHVFVVDRSCSDCKNDKNNCHCMKELAATAVKAGIDAAAKNKIVHIQGLK